VYENIRGQYWHGVNCVIAMYDVANKDSFSRVDAWINEVKGVAKGSGLPLLGVLIASKADLNDYAQTSAAEGKSLADKHGFKFFETSALTGKNADAPFQHIADETYKAYTLASSEAIGR
jgi:Ras-related protein Rab-2A